MNIFSKEMLKLLVDSSERLSFPQMYQQLLSQQGDMELLEYGVHSWTRANKLTQDKRNQSVIEQLIHKPAFSNNYKNWPDENLTAFCEFILFSQEQQLDFFTTKMDSGDSIRIGRKDVDDTNAKEVFATFEAQRNTIKYTQRYQYRDGYFVVDMSDSLLRTVRQSKHFQKFDAEYPIDRKPNKPKDYLGESNSNDCSDIYEVAENKTTTYTVGHMSPLNQILYGPPGTGKTYHAIDAAVKAAEPQYYASLNIDTAIGSTAEQRDALTRRYKELSDAGRIRFVTFHQSYGYEEFVEGLRASSEGNNVSYDVEAGVFKSICTEAGENQVTTRNVGIDDSFATCWAVFIAQFDEDGSRIETKKSFYTVTHFNEKTIYFEKSNGDTAHTLSINTLKDVYNNERAIKGGLDVYYQPLITHLRNLAPTSQVKEKNRKNYVLIIDEINRGNISKIFGELITLIEPSKRSGEGQDEAIELVLPYSGTKFSVPNNLHIIGTMNTADRSLAMMDTALRRRFDFIEMMPNTALFNGVIVDGIDLERMLKTMNKRIEVLYDREHTLGHAFFMPVKTLVDKGDQVAAFAELKLVFKNKIIPLLEEYFFEDWNKISLVLGDNQKELALRFIIQQKQSYDDIFGSNHGLDSYETENTSYSLAPFNGEGSVWNDPKAYIAIYPKESAQIVSIAEAG